MLTGSTPDKTHKSRNSACSVFDIKHRHKAPAPLLRGEERSHENVHFFLYRSSPRSSGVHTRYHRLRSHAIAYRRIPSQCKSLVIATYFGGKFCPFHATAKPLAIALTIAPRIALVESVPAFGRNDPRRHLRSRLSSATFPKRD